MVIKSSTAFFFAPLTVLFLYLSKDNPGKYFYIATFLLGLNIQMEASGAFFALFVVLIWVIITKIYKNVKAFAMGAGAFLLTLIPQLVF